MAPGRANLLLDQVEVVEQPFSRRRNPSIGLDCGREHIEGTQEDAFVIGQSSQQPVPNVPHSQLMRAGKELAVSTHLLTAEQLGPWQQVFAPRFVRRCISAQAHPKVCQRFSNGLAVNVQLSNFLSFRHTPLFIPPWAARPWAAWTRRARGGNQRG